MKVVSNATVLPFASGNTVNCKRRNQLLHHHVRRHLHIQRSVVLTCCIHWAPMVPVRYWKDACSKAASRVWVVFQIQFPGLQNPLAGCQNVCAHQIPAAG